MFHFNLRSESFFKNKAILLATFFLIFILDNIDIKAYCTPGSSYPGNYMWMNSTTFNTLYVYSGRDYQGYTYFSGYSTDVQAGSAYSFNVRFSNTYPMYMTIWIDILSAMNDE